MFNNIGCIFKSVNISKILIEGAYNRKDKIYPKKKTRKNPKKMYQ